MAVLEGYSSKAYTDRVSPKASEKLETINRGHQFGIRRSPTIYINENLLGLY